MSPEQAGGPAERAGALRRAVVHLVVGVTLLDAAALAVWFGAHIGQGPDRTRTMFVVVWTFATAVTVAVLLRRVRLARRLTLPPRG